MASSSTTNHTSTTGSAQHEPLPRHTPTMHCLSLQQRSTLGAHIGRRDDLPHWLLLLLLLQQ
jgi:hypothetical protein